MEAAVQGSTSAIRHEFNSRHVMMNKWCILTDLWCMTQFCQRATQFLKNVCRNFRHFWNPLSPALSWQGGRRVGACEKPKLANNWCCNHCNAGRPGLRVVGFERHFALGDNVVRVAGAEKMLQSSIGLLPMQCLMKETTVSKENRSSEIINVFFNFIRNIFWKNISQPYRFRAQLPCQSFPTHKLDFEERNIFLNTCTSFTGQILSHPKYKLLWCCSSWSQWW